MGPRQGSKGFLDDNSSYESISFAGLLPKHEQQRQQQQQQQQQQKQKQKFSSSNQVRHSSQASFEFSTAGVHSKVIPASRSTTSPADALISNGKLVPHSFAVQSTEHKGPSPKVHQSIEIRSMNSPKIERSFDRKPHAVSRQAGEEKKVKKSCMSILLCRESHAISPTIKAHNV